MARGATQYHRNLMNLTNTAEKELLLKGAMEREEDEDTNACTTDESSTSNILSESDRGPEYNTNCNGNVNELNELTDNTVNNDDSHAIIITSPKMKDNDLEKSTNSQINRVEEQTVSDIPTDITHNSSSHKENGDDRSIDTVSTIGIDSSLNESNRCIFPRYWGVNSSRRSHRTEQPSGISYCHVEASLRNDLSKISRSDSTNSHKEEYEMALKGYEHSNTSILSRTTSHNEKPDKAVNAKMSMVDEPLTKVEKYDSSQDEKLRKVLDESASQHNFNDRLPKICSTSALLSIRKPPRKSCLRPRSLCGAESEGSGRVTFNPNVSMVKYREQHELHASEGWSKWFV